VTLEEMYKGSTRKMNINRNIYCDDCRGSGAKDGKLKKCPKCKGQGVTLQMVNMGMMQMQMQQPCQQCGGKGNTMAAKCKKCRGGRLIQETKLLEINVEKGMSDADTILFEKQGEQVPDQARGDLVFSIRQRPHNRFKRVGNNLFMDLTISLEESLLGFRRTITHLDNH
jgi:DnaJ family protein A protein 2